MSGYDSTKGYNFRFTKKQEGIVEEAAKTATGTLEPQNPPIKVGPIEKAGVIKPCKGKLGEDDGAIYSQGSR